MDRNKLFSAPLEQQLRSVRLDQHDSVRSHVRQQIRHEVERLEGRIETLRLTRAPHAAIMISTYERMVERKKGFLKNWDMLDLAAH